MPRPYTTLLTAAERATLDAHVRSFEARTGVEALCVVSARADDYSELPWRAFALGAALAGLAVVADELLRPQWLHAHTLLASVVIVLGVGALSALVAVAVPTYARWFLSGVRAEAEVRAHAKTLALDRGLTHTPHRRAVLVVASAFERRMAGVADIGVATTLDAAVWRRAIEDAAPAVRHRDFAGAVHTVLDVLERALLAAGVRAKGAQPNLLGDRPIEDLKPDPAT